MRILDDLSNESVKNISIYLTLSEAIELRNSLSDLIQNPKNNHAHIPSEDFQKEITVSIYKADDLEGFDERSISLITNDT